MENQTENQVETQPKNQKNEKGLIVLVVILVLLVLGLGGYIVYDKVFTKETKEPEKTEKKEETVKFENIDVSSNEVVALYNSIDVFNDDFWGGKDYYGYLYKQDNLLAANMPSDVKVMVGIQNALKECGDDCKKEMGDGGTKITIDAAKVDNQIKKIFGNINYENTNTKAYNFCNESGYTYQNNAYSTTQYGCGITGVPSYNLKTRIIKAEKNNKELNIYANIIYVEPNQCQNYSEHRATWVEADCIIDISVYKDVNKTQLIEKTLENLWSDNGISEQTMIKYQDKLDTYKLHFENENGEYHFKSIAKQ